MTSPPAPVVLVTGFPASTPRIGLWLDTSDMTVDETLAEILRRGPGEAIV